MKELYSRLRCIRLHNGQEDYNSTVYINQRDANLLMNDLYYILIGSTCYGLSPVHHQEHHLINCITHCVQAGLALAVQQLDSPDSTNTPMLYTVYEMMLLMMDW